MARYYASQRLSVCPFVRPFVGYDYSLRGANIIQHVCSTESVLFSVIRDHQARVALFGKKTGHAPNTCTPEHYSTIPTNRATVYNSIRSLPPKTA